MIRRCYNKYCNCEILKPQVFFSRKYKWELCPECFKKFNEQKNGLEKLGWTGTWDLRNPTTETRHTESIDEWIEWGLA